MSWTPLTPSVLQVRCSVSDQLIYPRVWGFIDLSGAGRHFHFTVQAENFQGEERDSRVHASLCPKGLGCPECAQYLEALGAEENVADILALPPPRSAHRLTRNLFFYQLQRGTCTSFCLPDLDVRARTLTRARKTMSSQQPDDDQRQVLGGKDYNIKAKQPVL